MSPPTSQSRLFSPLQIGQCSLQHRVVMAPLTRFRVASDTHTILPMAVEYYAQRCSEPGGLIIAESNIISPEHGGAPDMPGIWNETQIAAWKPIVDAVHAKGCFIYCQIIALGRVADAKTLENEAGGPFPVVSASDVPLSETIPKPLTLEQIKSTVTAFAQASKNAIAAGFDGVEAHGANGYLIDQFTQDTSNRRTDAYGGSIEGRARFAIEVAQAMVDAIGPERVGFRISPFSVFQGMKMADPVPQFAYLVAKLAELKLSYLHLVESRVINWADVEKVEGIEPFLDIWGKTSPVLVAGGFTPASAQKAVDVEYPNNETAVVFGRHFISNPDLPFRIRSGVELNKYDRTTFYAPRQVEGYLDYPFCEEYQKV